MVGALSPNAEQIDAWNDGVGKAWVANVDALDRQIGPIGDAAIAAAAVQPGDSVLDVGCGAGQTTFQLAPLVGPTGWALGVDISGLMIGAAAAEGRRRNVLNASFEIADAQTAPLRRAAYDVVFSRFGVMFFQDPVAAFVNMRTALKPQGRLAFCCWRAPAENPLMIEPAQAAAALLPAPVGPPPDPLAPGPFAFADQDRVRGILAGAGFLNISIERWDGVLGANSLDDAVRIATDLGPLGRRLNELHADAALRQKAQAAVRGALQKFIGEDGKVRAPGAAWIVRAN